MMGSDGDPSDRRKKKCVGKIVFGVKFGELGFIS